MNQVTIKPISNRMMILVRTQNRLLFKTLIQMRKMTLKKRKKKLKKSKSRHKNHSQRAILIRKAFKPYLKKNIKTILGK